MGLSVLFVLEILLAGFLPTELPDHQQDRQKNL